MAESLAARARRALGDHSTYTTRHVALFGIAGVRMRWECSCGAYGYVPVNHKGLARLAYQEHKVEALLRG